MSYDSLRQARSLIAEIGGEVAPLPVSEEELNPEIQDDLSYQVNALESSKHPYKVNYNYRNSVLRLS